MNELYSLPRNDVVALAKRAKQKLRNAELDRQRITDRAMAVGIGGAAAFGMGYVMGGLQAEAEANGTAGGDEDPTKVAGIDLDLLVGGAATIAGVLMSGKSSTRKIGEFVEAAGTGIVAGALYTYGLSVGREA